MPSQVVVPSLILPPITHSVRKLAFFRILGWVSRCFCRLDWERWRSNSPASREILGGEMV